MELPRAERLERTPSSRIELGERLSNLPPGHPSAPRDEHGAPRPPAPRLSDLEPPLSDAAYAARRDEVAKILRQAHGALQAVKDEQTVNPDKDIWSDDRIARQDEIVRKLYATAADVPCEGKAIIAGGLGGSGKTTVLEQHAGVDLSRYFTINPDQCKEELALHKMLPQIEGLSPMETSSLGHEESSFLARRLALLGYAEGRNVIWDITMSRPDSATTRIKELRDAGYEHIEGIFVDIPIETSVARSEGRHRRGHDLYLAGEGLGGRYVPAELIRSQADPKYGSINRRAFEEAKSLLDAWAIYDNSVDGRPPVIVDRSTDDADQGRLESRP
jgi:predicted ABC-type ATPase